MNRAVSDKAVDASKELKNKLLRCFSRWVERAVVFI
jgi:hypothetical protein